MSLVVSCKLEIYDEEWRRNDVFASQAVIDGINQHLPPSIRVFEARKIMASKAIESVDVCLRIKSF